MKKVIDHFKKVDPKIYEEMMKVISSEGEENLKITLRGDSLFESLCSSIINQQLSNKAAATIFSRFKSLFPKGNITPEKLSKISPEEIRAAGISYPKIKYLKDLVNKIISKEIELEKFEKLHNEKIIEELILVKGIGKWTAEMFLMFALGREDVFSYGDLILRRAVKNLYGFKKEPTVEEVEKITIKWSPYRTYAARVIWRSWHLEQR